jgi:hypothetical protein
MKEFSLTCSFILRQLYCSRDVCSIVAISFKSGSKAGKLLFGIVNCGICLFVGSSQAGYGSNWNWNMPQNGPAAQGGPGQGAPGPQGMARLLFSHQPSSVMLNCTYWNLVDE